MRDRARPALALVLALVLLACALDGVAAKGGRSSGSSRGRSSYGSRSTRRGYTSSGRRSCSSCYYSSSGAVYHRSFYFMYIPCYGCHAQRRYCHECNTKAAHNKQTFTLLTTGAAFEVEFKKSSLMNVSSADHRKWATNFSRAARVEINHALHTWSWSPLGNDSMTLSFFLQNGTRARPPLRPSAGAHVNISVMTLQGQKPTQDQVVIAMQTVCNQPAAIRQLSGEGYRVLRCVGNTTQVHTAKRTLNATLTNYEDKGTRGGSLGAVVLVIFLYMVVPLAAVGIILRIMRYWVAKEGNHSIIGSVCARCPIIGSASREGGMETFAARTTMSTSSNTRVTIERQEVTSVANPTARATPMMVQATPVVAVAGTNQLVFASATPVVATVKAAPLAASPPGPPAPVMDDVDDEPAGPPPLIQRSQESQPKLGTTAAVSDDC